VAVIESVIRRLALSVVAMLGVITIVFLLLHVSGDPATLLVSQDATQQDIDRIRQAYGLDQPLSVQYARFVTRGGRRGMLPPPRHGSAVDTAAMTVALLGTSVPSFWLSLLLIIIFGVQL